MFLSDFLFDVNHSKEQNSFKFNGTLVCNEPVPPIIVSGWSRSKAVNNGGYVQATQQQLFYGLSGSLPPPTEYLPAKVDFPGYMAIIYQALVDTIIREANLSSTSFATSPVSWSFVIAILNPFSDL